MAYTYTYTHAYANTMSAELAGAIALLVGAISSVIILIARQGIGQKLWKQSHRERRKDNGNGSGLLKRWIDVVEKDLDDLQGEMRRGFERLEARDRRMYERFVLKEVYAVEADAFKRRLNNLEGKTHEHEK